MIRKKYFKISEPNSTKNQQIVNTIIKNIFFNYFNNDSELKFEIKCKFIRY
jgi:hypothetical protein